MTDLAPVTELNLDLDLYPRAGGVSDHHVADLIRVMDGGHPLPPIVVCRKTKRIADGAHRWIAAVRRNLATIAVEWRDYASDAEFFSDAVLLNTGQGLNLTTHDRLKVIAVGRDFGLKELDIAALLRTSESYVKTLLPRYATVTTPESTAGRVRRVPLKASTRHLSGQAITPAQADAIAGNAPGTSYLLIVRQLTSGLRHGLLPPPEQHPVLWQELAALRALLGDTASV